MGNSESTSRMIAMQRGEDGIIQVSENVMDHLHGKRSLVHLDDDEQVINKSDLKLLVEKTLREGKRQEMEKYKAELEKWQRRLKEADEEKEKLRILAEQGDKQIADSVVDDAHWKSTFEEAKKAEYETLSAQLKADQQQKLTELETYYQNLLQETTKKTIDEVKENMAAQHHEQVKEIIEKEKEILRTELLHQGQISTVISEEELQKTRDALSHKFEEEAKEQLKAVEEKWQLILQEETNKTREEVRGVVEAEQEAKLAEMKSQFQTILDEKLEAEKEKLNADYIEKEKLVIDAIERRWLQKMEEETEQKLKEEGERWQLVLVEEGDKLTDAVRIEVEGEQIKKVAEMEERCLAAYNETLEVEKQKLQAANLEKEQQLIEEIEARWMSKLQAKEEEHAEEIKNLQEAHQNEKNLANSKILEQEELTKSIEKRLALLQFRKDDVQQQFDDKVSEVESKIAPLRQNAVCVDTRAIAMHCYKTYPSHPLRCSDEVQKFINCVQDERVKLLQRNTAS